MCFSRNHGNTRPSPGDSFQYMKLLDLDDKYHGMSDVSTALREVCKGLHRVF